MFCDFQNNEPKTFTLIIQSILINMTNRFVISRSSVQPGSPAPFFIYSLLFQNIKTLIKALNHRLCR
jgi:hypothetical protein